MNILYICHRFPFPAKDGSRVRSFNIIKHFEQQGHRVWVSSMVRDKQEESQGQGIKEHCHQFTMARTTPWVQNCRMVSRLLSTEPSSMGYFYSATMKKQIEQLLAEQNFDLIYVHCSSVAQYVKHVAGIPKILDFVDMDSQKWLSFTEFKSFPMNFGYWLEGTKLERAERQLCAHFDLCTTITRAECDSLDKLALGGATNWFSNGVDSEYFVPTEQAYHRHQVCFIGKMDYYPNEQAVSYFCHHVLPLLRQSIPAAEFVIIGAAPSEKVKKLGELSGVTVTGFVDDVRDYVRKSAVMVAPLSIARGTQNKILEAMALGVPVVTSEIGARGIDGDPNKDFIVASSAQQYSDQLETLMSDQELRQRYARQGRLTIEENYSWTHVLQRLDALIQTTVSAGKPPLASGNT